MNPSSGAKMTKILQDEIHPANVTLKRDIQPLGLNAKRVIGKRYSLKDANDNAIEEWSDIVARVVAHVSVAETDPTQPDQFYNALEHISLTPQLLPNPPMLADPCS